MNILVTGGFGSIGVLVIEECQRRGHSVTVFELATKRTRRLARKYGRRKVRAVFGDIRSPEDVNLAVAGQDAVIHMAAILPPTSDRLPELCERVNVGGTENLVAAMREAPRSLAPQESRPARGNPQPARDAAESVPAWTDAGTRRPVMVYVSSAGVMGPTQKRTPPVRPDDPLTPTDIYSRSKIAAESLVSSSGIPWCVLRLAGVIPTVINYGSLKTMVKLLFSLPLPARCEMVIDLDVAAALVSAAENLRGDAVSAGSIAGRKGFIAGGKCCQVTSRGLINFMFPPMGLTPPDESLYTAEIDSYYLDWYDTEEIQAILKYQNHSLQDWLDLMLGKLRWALPLLRLFRGPIRKALEKQSPLYRISR